MLLVSTCRPSVLATQLVCPGDALFARTEGVGAPATVTADNIGEGVRLRAEDRRVGTVLITELRVDRDTIHWDVAVVDRGARVALGAGQIHVTRNQALTNALRVGQVSSLGDTTASDHVGINNLILRSRGSCVQTFLSEGSRSSSWVNNWLHKRAHHGNRKSGGCDRRTAATGRTVEFLHIHEESFHENN